MKKKQYDFSGYATRHDVLCSDGRIIKSGAFKHNDGKKVPLVWMHSHDNSENVLGHAYLENREEGVYTYGNFNSTPAGKNAKIMVENGDITALSIYANRLKQAGNEVIHGEIREVSLVLTGANPEAYIDNISMQHADGEDTFEAIIYLGDQLIHGEDLEEKEEKTVEVENKKEVLEHAEDKTIAEVLATLNEEQQNVVANLLTQIISPEDFEGDDSEEEGEVEHADGKTVQDVFDEMNEEQKTAVYALLSEALNKRDNTAEHADLGGDNMKTNVFENKKDVAEELELTHADFVTIKDLATNNYDGSFRKAFMAHAEATYGIENIDVLFPDARSVTPTPDFISREMGWVAEFLGATSHTPFSRIKSTAADITAEEARARGYVKGNLKKEEVIKLLKRVTIPTTIYKKQKLDRDDIIDITDLDVVAFLRAEMRVMLDEELARAALIGDGREIESEDKIDEERIRPIYKDAEMYTHRIRVSAESDAQSMIKDIIRARKNYKGKGRPNLYTTSDMVTEMLLLEDKMGRPLYETEQALANKLRVNRIIEVEVMEGVNSTYEINGEEKTLDLVCILVNPKDYKFGADKGGNVSMFDDFDIDYNQYKYLIETRVSGALVHPKTAIVVEKHRAGAVTEPAGDQG